MVEQHGATSHCEQKKHTVVRTAAAQHRLNGPGRQRTLTMSPSARFAAAYDSFTRSHSLPSPSDSACTVCVCEGETRW